MAEPPGGLLAEQLDELASRLIEDESTAGSDATPTTSSTPLISYTSLFESNHSSDSGPSLYETSNSTKSYSFSFTGSDQEDLGSGDSSDEAEEPSERSGRGEMPDDGIVISTEVTTEPEPGVEERTTEITLPKVISEAEVIIDYEDGEQVIDTVVQAIEPGVEQEIEIKSPIKKRKPPVFPTASRSFKPALTTISPGEGSTESNPSWMKTFRQIHTHEDTEQSEESTLGGSVSKRSTLEGNESLMSLLDDSTSKATEEDHVEDELIEEVEYTEEVVVDTVMEEEIVFESDDDTAERQRKVQWMGLPANPPELTVDSVELMPRNSDESDESETGSGDGSDESSGGEGDGDDEEESGYDEGETASETTGSSASTQPLPEQVLGSDFDDAEVSEYNSELEYEAPSLSTSEEDTDSDVESSDSDEGGPQHAHDRRETDRLPQTSERTTGSATPKIQLRRITKSVASPGDGHLEDTEITGDDDILNSQIIELDMTSSGRSGTDHLRSPTGTAESQGSGDYVELSSTSSTGSPLENNTFREESFSRSKSQTTAYDEEGLWSSRSGLEIPPSTNTLEAVPAAPASILKTSLREHRTSKSSLQTGPSEENEQLRSPAGELLVDDSSSEASSESAKSDSSGWKWCIRFVLFAIVAAVAGVLLYIWLLRDNPPGPSVVVPISTVSPSPTFTGSFTEFPTISPNDAPQPVVNPGDPTSIPASPTTSPTNGGPTPKPTVPFPPPNDQCSNAMGPITADSVIIGTVAGATSDVVDTCGDVSLNGLVGTWFKVLGTGGEMMAHTCLGTNFNSKITIFKGSCAKPECLEANDSFCGEQTAVSWNSYYQQEYLILVQGPGDSQGDRSFQLSILGRYNDECSTAIGPLSIGDGPVAQGDTLSANANEEISCDGNLNDSPGVFYVVKGTGGEMIASVCDDSSFDATLTLLEGSCSNLSCGVPTLASSCEVSWSSQPFRDYFIYIRGTSATAIGEFGLKVSTSAVPDNNLCSTALGPLPLDGTAVAGSTSGASPDPDAPFCVSAITAPGVWYFVVGDGRTIQASLCEDATFDTRISIFAGSCRSGDALEGLGCQAGNDDFCGTSSLVTWASVANKRYYILVHGYLAGSGDFNLAVTSI